ncbi:hypothetical protein HZH68_011228 [Vespula germanica]|uniref:Uncharacterized protein n=1 Tax=Vespula germanica TaxID=30212 RepID=A0A834N0V2_VESGE|nr:hypothetical protein HZH68_011228 [Vespula germanica]
MTSFAQKKQKKKKPKLNSVQIQIGSRITKDHDEQTEIRQHVRIGQRAENTNLAQNLTGMGDLSGSLDSR